MTEKIVTHLRREKPTFTALIDKIVINVDASPSNSGATVIEVLEKAPGVSVDKDGNISLKNKQMRGWRISKK